VSFVKIGAVRVIFFDSVNKYFPYFTQDYLFTNLGRFGITDFHVMRLSTREFRENRCSKTHTLLRSVSNILPCTFYIFRPIWIKFDTGELHIMPLCQCDFCELPCSGRYAL